jgi:gluconolactonase
VFVFEPPKRLKTEIVFRLPEQYRNKRRSAWSDPNRLNEPVDSFLEGPSFDRADNLYFVDIPFGRVFRLSPSFECDLIAEYDGWPNGLKIHRDGRIFICDYKRGLLVLDPARGTVEPILATRKRGSTISSLRAMATAISPTRAKPACTTGRGAFTASRQITGSIV